MFLLFCDIHYYFCLLCEAMPEENSRCNEKKNKIEMKQKRDKKMSIKKKHALREHYLFLKKNFVCNIFLKYTKKKCETSSVRHPGYISKSISHCVQ